jgi:hypothetical protein
MNFKSSIVAASLVTFGVSGIAQEMVSYSIKLGEQNSNLGRCAVNVEIAGIGDIDIVAAAPNYVVTFSIPAAQNRNHSVIVKGKGKWGIPPNNAPACAVDGQILINQLILDEWKPIKEKFAGTESLRCLNLGLSRIGERIDGPAASEKLYIRPTDQKSKTIFDACDSLLAEPLKNDVPCNLTEPKVKSVCEEHYFSERNPNRRLKIDAALYAILEGQQVKRGLWETNDAKAARAEQQRKDDERRRAQEEERERLAKQREEREAWLRTAEGKKFLADEAIKAARAREEADRQAAAEKARRDRVAAEARQKEKLLRDQCENMKSWASDSRELVANALKVSIQSVSLIRFQMGNSCIAIVDTPKGPQKCLVRDILQNKKTGEYFADLGGPLAIQAVCGGMAF